MTKSKRGGSLYACKANAPTPTNAAYGRHSRTVGQAS